MAGTVVSSKKAGRAPRAEKPRRTSKSELKLQAILDAAARVLRRRGYAEATLAEIAKEAGTQAGSLYYYFDSRDALVEEVLVGATKRLAEAVDAALATLPPDAPVFDRLVVTIRAHSLIVLEHDDYSGAYQKVHDQVSEEMRHRISAAAARSYARFWEKLIAEAMEEDIIRKDYDARLLRLLLIGSISWMVDWHNPKGPSDPDTIANTIVRLFFQGAGTPKARRASAKY